MQQSNIPSVISKQSSEEAHHDSIGGRFYARNFCRKFESLGCSACLSLKSQNSAFLRNTYLHKLIGELEAKILLKPGTVMTTSSSVNLCECCSSSTTLECKYLDFSSHRC